jgi:hypothetical protein
MSNEGNCRKLPKLLGKEKGNEHFHSDKGVSMEGNQGLHTISWKSKTWKKDLSRR